MIRRFLRRLPQKWRDAASRAAWTGIQAGLPILGVIFTDLPPAVVPFAALGLSWLKSYIATKVGNPATVTFDVGHAGLAGTGPELHHGGSRLAGHSITQSTPEPPPQPVSGRELRRRASGRAQAPPPPEPGTGPAYEDDVANQENPLGGDTGPLARERPKSTYRSRDPLVDPFGPKFRGGN